MEMTQNNGSLFSSASTLMKSRSVKVLIVCVGVALILVAFGWAFRASLSTLLHKH